MQGNALQMHSFTHSFIHSHSSLQDYRFYVLWGVEGKAGLTTYAKPRLTAMYKYMALHVGMNTAASASLTSARIFSPVACAYQTRSSTACALHNITYHPWCKGLLATRLQVTSSNPSMFTAFGLFIFPLFWERE